MNYLPRKLEKECVNTTPPIPIKSTPSMRMANKRTIDGSPTYVEPPSHTVHAFYENWQTKEPLISKETKWRRIVRFLLNDGYCSKIFLKFMLSFNPFVEISSKQASDALLFNLSVGAPRDTQERTNIPIIWGFGTWVTCHVSRRRNVSILILSFP